MIVIRLWLLIEKPFHRRLIMSSSNNKLNCNINKHIHNSRFAHRNTVLGGVGTSLFDVFLLFFGYRKTPS